LDVLAYPPFGSWGGGGCGRGAVEESVPGTRVHDDRPLLVPLALDGAKLGNALHRGNVSVGAAVQPEGRDGEPLQVGPGIDSEGRGFVLSLPPANSSYLATRLC
jgi:hypothetical protein